jgi:hypothetical protein
MSRVHVLDIIRSRDEGCILIGIGLGGERKEDKRRGKTRRWN